MNISDLNRIKKSLNKQLRELELRTEKYLTANLAPDASIDQKESTFEQRQESDKIFLELCASYRATIKTISDLERKKY